MNKKKSGDEFAPVNDESRRQAFEYVQGLKLPDRVAIDQDSFLSLPASVKRLALILYESCHDALGDTLPGCIAVSVKYLWYAAAKSAFFLKIICENGKPEEFMAESLFNPIDFAEGDGWACTAYTELVYIEQGQWVPMLWEQSGLSYVDDMKTVLHCLALHYYAEASRAAAANDVKAALAALSEAGESESLAEGQRMFEEGYGYAKEEPLNEARSTLGKAGASARHKENRAIKQYVFSWLDAHPPSPRGKDRAAEGIAGRVVNMSFRTIRGWIDEWEKLRSTGKP